jgi:hypothetical protein
MRDVCGGAMSAAQFPQAGRRWVVDLERSNPILAIPQVVSENRTYFFGFVSQFSVFDARKPPGNRPFVSLGFLGFCGNL